MKEDSSQLKQLFDLYGEYFFLSNSRKLELVDDFYESLKEGLKSHTHPKPNSVCHHSDRKPFKMLDSCVEKLPTGNEKGVHYAIDMGGTNLRCVRVDLLGNGQSNAQFKKIKLSEMKVPAPLKAQNGNKYSKVEQEINILDKNVSSETMFNSIALFFSEFLKECGDLTDLDNAHQSQQQPQTPPLKVALTFSFPTQQFEINSANLITWTKGIEAGRSTDDHIEGKDVGDLLNSAFKRNGIPAQCECVINDTVGTLLSAMYDLNINHHNANSDAHKVNTPTAKRPESKPLIGIVVGTGVNACYFESNSSRFGYKGTIINTECGDFFSSKLPSTDCDLSIDWLSDNRGEQRLEKMISGTYLGEISRLLIIKFLKNHTPKALFDKNSLKTEHIAEIVGQYDNCNQSHQPDLTPIEKYLKKTFSSQFDHYSTSIIVKISQMVLIRAASLVSILLAALIKKVNESHSEVTIAVDGSVWNKIPAFQKYVRDSLSSIIIDKNTLNSIHFYDSDDGSGRGAAILASTICHAS